MAWCREGEGEESVGRGEVAEARILVLFLFLFIRATFVVRSSVVLTVRTVQYSYRKTEAVFSPFPPRLESYLSFPPLSGAFSHPCFSLSSSPFQHYSTRTSVSCVTTAAAEALLLFAKAVPPLHALATHLCPVLSSHARKGKGGLFCNVPFKKGNKI